MENVCQALSITVPILLRGCQEKKTESKRRVCVIADNMCKLIDHAHEATTYLPELKPEIQRLADEMSDPEAHTKKKVSPSLFTGESHYTE